MTAVEVIGPGIAFAPPADAGRHAMLGVTPAASFAGACSLVVIRGAKRLRIDLSSAQVAGVTGVLSPSDDASTYGTTAEVAGKVLPIYLRRDGNAVLLTVGELRLTLSGDDLRGKLVAALRYWTRGSAARCGECTTAPSTHPVALTQTEADLLGVHPGLYDAVVVDRREDAGALIVVFDVVGDAGEIAGRLSRRFGGEG